MILKHLSGNLKRYYAFFVLLLLLIGCCSSWCVGKVIVSQKDLGLIGDMVFFNECGEKLDLIVCWNKGEDFMSLGLGHFIWYQKDKDNRFEESRWLAGWGRRLDSYVDAFYVFVKKRIETSKFYYNSIQKRRMNERQMPNRHQAA